MTHLDRTSVVELAVGAVLVNASNFPRKAQVHLLGQDLAPLRQLLTTAVVNAMSQADAAPAGTISVAMTADELEQLETCVRYYRAVTAVPAERDAKLLQIVGALRSVRKARS